MKRGLVVGGKTRQPRRPSRSKSGQDAAEQEQDVFICYLENK